MSVIRKSGDRFSEKTMLKHNMGRDRAPGSEGGDAPAR
jgi:hypothetical protein